MRKLPRTMSTQHPDNARVPEWARREVIEGDDEVLEAYFAYSSLGVHEVMWDAEGKDVDTHVVRKLFSSFQDYFRENVLGEDIFLTYRLPNPKIEGAERKVFAETMESVPITFDVAEKFYGKRVVPVFEVILPFTTEAMDLISVARYYERAVAAEEDVELYDGVRVRDLVGEIYPKKIEVIPLIEDRDSLFKTGEILEGYFKAVKPSYMRVFIARSDPAMNYGMLSAVLLAKYALSSTEKFSKKVGIPVFPIIGVGSLPFRGHLSPENYIKVSEEYLGVHTFTVQSAFKYDYPQEKVREAISFLNSLPQREPRILDEREEKILKGIVGKYTSRYQPTIESMADLINRVSLTIPPRRARKLHISLFGYARSTGRVTLPRAITFVGALYSIGIPPEIIGVASLSGLNQEEWEVLGENYKYMRHDLSEASKFFSWNSLDLISSWIGEEVIKSLREDVKFLEDNLGVRVGPKDYESKKHTLLSELLILALREGRINEAREYIKEMAMIRRSIG